MNMTDGLSHSTKSIAAVLEDPNLTVAGKLTIIALLHSECEGDRSPSAMRLSRLTSLSVRSLSRELKRLEDSGAIRRSARPGHAWTYEVQIGMPTPPARQEETHPVKIVSDTVGDVGTIHDSSTSGDGMAPEPARPSENPVADTDDDGGKRILSVGERAALERQAEMRTGEVRRLSDFYHAMIPECWATLNDRPDCDRLGGGAIDTSRSIRVEELEQAAASFSMTSEQYLAVLAAANSSVVGTVDGAGRPRQATWANAAHTSRTIAMVQRFCEMMNDADCAHICTRIQRCAERCGVRVAGLSESVRAHCSRARIERILEESRRYPAPPDTPENNLGAILNNLRSGGSAERDGLDGLLATVKRMLVNPEVFGNFRLGQVLMADPRLRKRAIERGIDVPAVSDQVAIQLAQMPEVRALLDALAEHGVIGGSTSPA